MEAERFDSTEDLKKAIKERRDDFDGLVLHVIDAPFRVGNREMKGAFAKIMTCSGGSWLVNLESAEELINEGFFHQNRIPVRLEKTPPPMS